MAFCIIGIDNQNKQWSNGVSNKGDNMSVRNEERLLLLLILLRLLPRVIHELAIPFIGTIVLSFALVHIGIDQATTGELVGILGIFVVIVAYDWARDVIIQRKLIWKWNGKYVKF